MSGKEQEAMNPRESSGPAEHAGEAEEAVARGRALLSRAARVLVLTGSGISADSGVPTFRGPEGLWKDHRPEDLATPEAFRRDPQLVWEWYAWRRRKVAACAPNAAHLALARWMLGRDGALLVTQNVDGLHGLALEDAVAEARGGAGAVGAAEADAAAATPAPMDPERLERARPVELHGSLFRVRCTGCGARSPRREPVDASAEATLPRCEACGALLRPDVVWFGESLPAEALERAFRAAEEAEACLVVGTSALVQPAASLPEAARRAGAALVEVNPEPTPLSARADVALQARAARAVPALLGEAGGP